MNVADVAHEIQKFQNVQILRLNLVAFFGGAGASFNDAANRTIKESVHRVIKKIERSQRVFVLVLDFLRRLLEAGEHGAFAAGKMRANVTVSANFHENFLH